jgi:hypothetical protein
MDQKFKEIWQDNVTKRVKQIFDVSLEMEQELSGEWYEGYCAALHNFGLVDDNQLMELIEHSIVMRHERS